MADALLEFNAFIHQYWWEIALVWGIIVAVLAFIIWRRRGKDYGPTTVVMEFMATGISEPNYVAREDQGPSFAGFYRADGNMEWRKKSRIAISIPDRKGQSYDILYFNPRQSDSCVEIDELFDGYVPREQVVEEIVSEHANQFQIMRKMAKPSDWAGSKGKIVLIAVVILGAALGLIADASFIHAGAR